MDRKGFERLTIAEISKKAGVSVGAFYHYFRSKDDILAEIFRRADDYFLTHVVGDLDQRTIPEQIVRYFDHYAKFNVTSGVEMTQQLFNPKVKLFIQKGRPMQTILAGLDSERARKRARSVQTRGRRTSPGCCSSWHAASFSNGACSTAPTISKRRCTATCLNSCPH